MQNKTYNGLGTIPNKISKLKKGEKWIPRIQIYDRLVIIIKTNVHLAQALKTVIDIDYLVYARLVYLFPKIFPNYART